MKIVPEGELEINNETTESPHKAKKPNTISIHNIQPSIKERDQSNLINKMYRQISDK
jgi:hypothetical protein